ncbi:endopeptidase La, partial [Xanthomonas citri pv. citri]|nr:endopeptidase La [Xanthomonas citri pv. citri]
MEDGRGYVLAEVTDCENSGGTGIGEASAVAMTRALKDIFARYCEENPKVGRELSRQILEINDLEKLVDQIAINLPLFYEDRQRLLEAAELPER